MPLPWLHRARAMRWPVLALVLMVAVGLTALIAQSGPAIRVRADELHPPERFQETIIEAKPPAIDPGQATITPPPCECWNKALKEKPSYFLTAFGGSSYFDSIDTSAGGMYGANAWVPIYGAFGAMGRFQMNNYSGGSQYGGSFGLYKGAAPTGGTFSRFGASILIDQFTDTAFGSPWLVQGQYAATYAVSNQLRIGARYIDPLHSGEVDNRLVIPGAPGSSPFGLVDSVEANVTLGASPMDSILFGVGYIDAFETMSYRLAASRTITPRLGLTFSAAYEEKIGLWTGFLGFQVDLSKKRLTDLRVASTSVPSSEDIVRGDTAFSYASLMASGSTASAEFWSGTPEQPSYLPSMDSNDYTTSIGLWNYNFPTLPTTQVSCAGHYCPPGFHADPNEGCDCVMDN